MGPMVEWIKQNPVIVASVVVIFLAFGSYFWPTASDLSFFQEQVKKVTKERGELEKLTRTQITLPPQTAGGKPQQISALINEEAVKNLKQAFKKMNDNYQELATTISERNQKGHRISIDKPDEVFPVLDKDGVRKFTLQNEFMRAYLQAIVDNMNGAPPLDKLTITERMKEVRTIFRQKNVVGFAGQQVVLSPDLQKRLAREQAGVYMNMIEQHALKISYYCDLPVLPLSDPTIKDRPGDWTLGFISPFPTWLKQANIENVNNVELVRNAWETQRHIWMVTDILKAIKIANTDESGQWIPVTQAPVKRIESIELLQSIPFAAGNRIIPPVITEKEPNRAYDVPIDYAKSPTGRIPNQLYDVRYIKLVVVVDAGRQQKLINAIGQVNFMTPCIKSITNVDEIAEMKADNYFYGYGDAIRMEMYIETLWLWNWMKRWDPTVTSRQ